MKSEGNRTVERSVGIGEVDNCHNRRLVARNPWDLRGNLDSVNQVLSPNFEFTMHDLRSREYGRKWGTFDTSQSQ
jgi:hypothetical protein